MSETENNLQKPAFPKLYIAFKIVGAIFIMLGFFLEARILFKHENNPDVLWNRAMDGVLSFVVGCGFFMLSTLTKTREDNKRKFGIVYVIVYAVVLLLVAIVFYLVVKMLTA
ncbi:MAG: hypothetical protein ACYTE8_05545 [Planctomycetota bacterium]